MTVSAGQSVAGGGAAAPPRAPLVCGALGSYERDRVLAIAARLGDETLPAHEDERSMLALDREPIAWEGPRERGLGWVEGVSWRGAAAEWRQAARNGACGLAFHGRRPFLHSSVSGLGALYWLEDGDAVYFSSRIEPLAMSAPRKLTVDWDAWAATIVLRYPLGTRTPFAEIQRLGPFSTLGRRRGRRRVRAHSWPWAEIEPNQGAEAAADDAAEAMRETLTLPGGPALCPLSGGLDSRLLISALAGLGRNELTALTVNDDEGGRLEEELAGPVARKLGVAHELIETSADEYPAEWEERAALVEHQFVDHAWLTPLARRVAGSTSPVTDGYTLDTFLQTGARMHRADVVEAPSPRAGSLALFESVRQYGHADLALDPRFHRPLVERTRSQFEEVVRPFEGHPSQPILALYASRTVRGISTYPGGLLGSGARVVVPTVDDRVATALLSAPSAEKRQRKMQSALQRRLAPQVAGMASTGDVGRAPPRLPRRWRSPQALAAYRERIESGPLAPHVAPALTAWLADPGPVELSPDLRLGMEAIGLFHTWWDRYRDCLHDVDPADLAG